LTKIAIFTGISICGQQLDFDQISPKHTENYLRLFSDFALWYYRTKITGAKGEKILQKKISFLYKLGIIFAFYSILHFQYKAQLRKYIYIHILYTYFAFLHDDSGILTNYQLLHDSKTHGNVPVGHMSDKRERIFLRKKVTW